MKTLVVQWASGYTREWQIEDEMAQRMPEEVADADWLTFPHGTGYVYLNLAQVASLTVCA